jgi:rare lipoprotein A
MNRNKIYPLLVFLIILAAMPRISKLRGGEDETLAALNFVARERVSVSRQSATLRHRVENLDKRIDAVMLPAVASWYGGKFHGRRTASGEIYDQWGNTCACNFLPFGTWVLLAYNGRRTFARVTDRGDFCKYGRHFDLSRGVAEHLKLTEKGVVEIKFKVICLEERRTDEN